MHQQRPQHLLYQHIKSPSVESVSGKNYFIFNQPLSYLGDSGILTNACFSFVFATQFLRVLVVVKAALFQVIGRLLQLCRWEPMRTTGQVSQGSPFLSRRSSNYNSKLLRQLHQLHLLVLKKERGK